MCFFGGPSSAEKAQREQIALQRQIEAQRQAEINAAIAKANGYFDDRSPYYQNVYDATYDTNMDDLIRQYEDTKRQLKFALARKSGQGTPQEAYMMHRLKEVYDRGLDQVRQLAESTRQAFISDDETTRANLISRAQAGLGAGQIGQLATTKLNNNTQSWLNRAGMARLQDVFSDFAKQYAGGQTLAGYRAAYNDPRNQEWLGTYNAGAGSGAAGYAGQVS